MNRLPALIFKTHNFKIWLGLLLILLSACSSGRLPTVNPVSDESAAKIESACKHLFAESPIQYVHSLEVALPGQAASSVIGVTNVFPSTRRLESVIITVEGLVVFHARFAKHQIQILKSIKPFSSQEFSLGLLRDIQLIFLKPNGTLIGLGLTDGGIPTCLYQTQEKNLVEILLKSDNRQEIRKYNNNKQLIRTVEFFESGSATQSSPVPKRIILHSHDLLEYTLNMKLISTDLPNQKTD